MKKPKYYCWDYPSVSCCSSCHSDWDYGYGDPFEEEHDDFIWVRCCSAEVPDDLKKAKGELRE